MQTNYSSPFVNENVKPYPFWLGHTHAFFCTFTMPEKMYVSIWGKRKQWKFHTYEAKCNFYHEFINTTMEYQSYPYYSFEIHPNLGHDNVHCHAILLFDKDINFDESLIKTRIFNEWMRFSKIKVDMIHNICDVKYLPHNDDYIKVLNYIFKDDETHTVLFTPKLEREFRALGGRGANNPVGTSEADNTNQYINPFD